MFPVIYKKSTKFQIGRCNSFLYDLQKESLENMVQ
jgi:hypothetical protein